MRKFSIILLCLLAMTVDVLWVSSGKARAFCFEDAAKVYGLSPDLLKAIARVESGFKAEAVKLNKDGSYDYGLMQINSFWYGVLGDEIWDRLSEPCANVYVGAWILRRCIQ